jgi:hypothetical protein
MARTLSERDQEILKKLAPELCDPLCPGSGHEFFSILPPVSNHFSVSDEDFLARIRRLSPGDLEYLVGLVLDGSESVSCVRPEHIVLFAEEVAETLSPELGERIIRVYASEGSCA